MNKLSNFRLMLVAAVGFAAVPSVAIGQELANAAAVNAVATVIEASAVETPVNETVSLSGPRIVQAGITRATVATATAPLHQNRASRRDVKWMIFGGAAIVVGSFVDGDGGTIITITGAVVGLIGLWRYLQYS